MNNVLESILIGTVGLSIAAAISLYLAIRADRSSLDAQAGNLALLGIACHCIHFLEEYWTGFYVGFPTLLGLSVWPASFFVVFNVVLIAIWILSVRVVSSGRWFSLFPLWFLALGSSINGLAHPALAFVSGGYFSGLLTSPIVGVLGVLMVRSLSKANLNAA